MILLLTKTFYCPFYYKYTLVQFLYQYDTSSIRLAEDGSEQFRNSYRKVSKFIKLQRISKHKLQEVFGWLRPKMIEKLLNILTQDMYLYSTIRYWYLLNFCGLPLDHHKLIKKEVKYLFSQYIQNFTLWETGIDSLQSHHRDKDIKF